MNNQNGLDLTALAIKKEQERETKLQEIISEATARGKETFDYQRFVDSYWRKSSFSTPLNGNESKRMINAYRRRYYMDFPSIMTIEEYAHALEIEDEIMDF